MSKKQKSSGKPEGDSKYAKKCKARAKLAKKLNLPANTPYPIIWLNWPFQK